MDAIIAALEALTGAELHGLLAWIDAACEWEFLYVNGHRTADAWLAKHFASIEKTSTVDLQRLVRVERLGHPIASNVVADAGGTERVGSPR